MPLKTSDDQKNVFKQYLQDEVRKGIDDGDLDDDYLDHLDVTDESDVITLADALSSVCMAKPRQLSSKHLVEQMKDSRACGGDFAGAWQMIIQNLSDHFQDLSSSTSSTTSSPLALNSTTPKAKTTPPISPFPPTPPLPPPLPPLFSKSSLSSFSPSAFNTTTPPPPPLPSPSPLPLSSSTSILSPPAPTSEVFVSSFASAAFNTSARNLELDISDDEFSDAADGYAPPPESEAAATCGINYISTPRPLPTSPATLRNSITGGTSAPTVTATLSSSALSAAADVVPSPPAPQSLSPRGIQKILSTRMVEEVTLVSNDLLQARGKECCGIDDILTLLSKDFKAKKLYYDFKVGRRSEEAFVALFSSFLGKPTVLEKFKEFIAQLEEFELLGDLVKFHCDDIIKIMDMEEGESKYTKACMTMYEITALVRPVNIQLMLELFHETKKQQDLLADKDVVILMGGTGAGKSTTVQFLSNVALWGVYTDVNDHIEAMHELPDELKSFKTSSSTVSETLTLNSLALTWNNGEDSIILVDTPGFGDTRSVEIDIANGYGLVQAMRRCKSVKPVILISELDLGSRLQNINDIGRLLQSMIRDLEEHISPVSYFFTLGWNKSQLESYSIHDRIMKKSSDTTVRFNATTTLILNDMKAKTMNAPMVIDPAIYLASVPEERTGRKYKSRKADALREIYLSEVCRTREQVLDHIKKGKGIPGNKFRTFIEPKSDANFTAQLNIHKAVITVSLNIGNSEMLSKKLGELKLINDAFYVNDSARWPWYSDAVGSFKVACEGKTKALDASMNLTASTNVETLNSGLKAMAVSARWLLDMEAVRAEHLCNKNEEDSYQDLKKIVKNSFSKLLTELLDNASSQINKEDSDEENSFEKFAEAYIKVSESAAFFDTLLVLPNGSMYDVFCTGAGGVRNSGNLPILNKLLEMLIFTTTIRFSSSLEVSHVKNSLSALSKLKKIFEKLGGYVSEDIKSRMLLATEKSRNQFVGKVEASMKIVSESIRLINDGTDDDGGNGDLAAQFAFFEELEVALKDEQGEPELKTRISSAITEATEQCSTSIRANSALVKAELQKLENIKLPAFKPPVAMVVANALNRTLIFLSVKRIAAIEASGFADLKACIQQSATDAASIAETALTTMSNCGAIQVVEDLIYDQLANVLTWSATTDYLSDYVHTSHHQLVELFEDHAQKAISNLLEPELLTNDFSSLHARLPSHAHLKKLTEIANRFDLYSNEGKRALVEFSEAVVVNLNASKEFFEAASPDLNKVMISLRYCDVADLILDDSVELTLESTYAAASSLESNDIKDATSALEKYWQGLLIAGSAAYSTEVFTLVDPYAAVEETGDLEITQDGIEVLNDDYFKLTVARKGTHSYTHSILHQGQKLFKIKYNPRSSSNTGWIRESDCVLEKQHSSSQASLASLIGLKFSGLRQRRETFRTFHFSVAASITLSDNLEVGSVDQLSSEQKDYEIVSTSALDAVPGNDDDEEAGDLNVLGFGPSDMPTKQQVNLAALPFHPDKGGENKMWLRVKQARENLLRNIELTCTRFRRVVFNMFEKNSRQLLQSWCDSEESKLSKEYDDLSRSFEGRRSWEKDKLVDFSKTLVCFQPLQKYLHDPERRSIQQLLNICADALRDLVKDALQAVETSLHTCQQSFPRDYSTFADKLEAAKASGSIDFFVTIGTQLSSIMTRLKNSIESCVEGGLSSFDPIEGEKYIISFSGVLEFHNELTSMNASLTKFGIEGGGVFDVFDNALCQIGCHSGEKAIDAVCISIKGALSGADLNHFQPETAAGWFDSVKSAISGRQIKNKEQNSRLAGELPGSLSTTFSSIKDALNYDSDLVADNSPPSFSRAEEILKFVSKLITIIEKSSFADKAKALILHFDDACLMLVKCIERSTVTAYVSFDSIHIRKFPPKLLIEELLKAGAIANVRGDELNIAGRHDYLQVVEKLRKRIESLILEKLKQHTDFLQSALDAIKASSKLKDKPCPKLAMDAVDGGITRAAHAFVDELRVGKMSVAIALSSETSSFTDKEVAMDLDEPDAADDDEMDVDGDVTTDDDKKKHYVLPLSVIDLLPEEVRKTVMQPIVDLEHNINMVEIAVMRSKQRLIDSANVNLERNHKVASSIQLHVDALFDAIRGSDRRYVAHLADEICALFDEALIHFDVCLKNGLLAETVRLLPLAVGGWKLFAAESKRKTWNYHQFHPFYNGRPFDSDRISRLNKKRVNLTNRVVQCLHSLFNSSAKGPEFWQLMASGTPQTGSDLFQVCGVDVSLATLSGSSNTSTSELQKNIHDLSRNAKGLVDNLVSSLERLSKDFLLAVERQDVSQLKLHLTNYPSAASASAALDKAIKSKFNDTCWNAKDKAKAEDAVRNIDELKQCAEHMFSAMADSILSGGTFDTAPELCTPNLGDKKKFFTEVEGKIVALQQAGIDLIGILPVVKTMFQDCKKRLLDKLTSVTASTKLDIGTSFPPQTVKHCENIQKSIDILRTCGEIMGDADLKATAKAEVGLISVAITEKVKDVRMRALNSYKDTIDTNPSAAMRDVVVRAIGLKRVSLNLPDYSELIEKELDELFDAIKREDKGAILIDELAGFLLSGSTSDKADDDTLAEAIRTDQKAFAGKENEGFVTITQSITIEIVCKQLRGDELDVDLIEKVYAEFLGSWAVLINSALFGGKNPETGKTPEETKDTISDFVAQAELLGAEARKYPSIETTRKIMELVCAYWTIDTSATIFREKLAATVASGIKAQTSYDSCTDTLKKCLRSAHPTQVTSIFRLLGIGVTPTSKSSAVRLQNHFIQILTGEGKSVTLAIVSVVLALSGYDVDCACYSEYLSRRDYDDFNKLFKAFRVDRNIKYGTFTGLCESFINDRGNIRNAIEKYMTNNELPTQSGAEIPNKKVLIIDEVDVCFSKDFYGGQYYPLASVRSEKIKTFVLQLWEERTSLRSFSAVEQLPSYAAVKDELSERDAIFEEVAKQMFADLRVNCDFAFLAAADQELYTGSHIVGENRIGYFDNDGISWTKQDGFRTMFLYIFEHERNPGKIDEDARNKKIALNVSCGGFSYAEIPRKYDAVLGVTGTLEDLSDKEKDILKNDFLIKLQTFVPSMFKKTNLDWVPNNKASVMIEEDNFWHESIMAEINLRRSQVLSLTGPKRPVLVFFENLEELEKFRNSPCVKDEKTFLVIDGTEGDRRKFLVGKSMAPGEITLLSRVLGRGTDFKCQGQVDVSGGVHVLQTFVTESKAEETQIKGRTARQNQKGSYSMVLNVDKLGVLGITPSLTGSGGHREGQIYDVETMRAKDALYDTINIRRNEKFDADYKSVTDRITGIREGHQQSIEFRDDLFKGAADKVKKFLFDTNSCHMDVSNKMGTTPRTIVMLDATGSMSSTIRAAKLAVELIVNLAFDLINGEGGEFGSSFELQVGVYRNYNSGRKIIEVSPWASSPEALNQFIRHQEVNGGMGNEAIEVALQHALGQHSVENPVGQVIIIGDVGGNTRAETDYKRRRYKEAHLMAQVYLDDMIKDIKSKGITLHAFATEQGALSSFQDMVSHANVDDAGICEYLNVFNSDAVQEFGEKITRRLLAQQQGGEKGKLTDNLMKNMHKLRVGYVSSE